MDMILRQLVGISSWGSMYGGHIPFRQWIHDGYIPQLPQVVISGDESLEVGLGFQLRMTGFDPFFGASKSGFLLSMSTTRKLVSF